jgi:hypothetical protein
MLVDRSKDRIGMILGVACQPRPVRRAPATRLRWLQGGDVTITTWLSSHWFVDDNHTPWREPRRLMISGESVMTRSLSCALWQVGVGRLRARPLRTHDAPRRESASTGLCTAKTFCGARSRIGARQCYLSCALGLSR